MKNILECDCAVCTLNGRQGRSQVTYEGVRYCTAHPAYMAMAMLLVSKPAPKVVEDYVLSYMDFKGVEQDYYIRASTKEEAVKQAKLILMVMGCNKRNATLIREQVIEL